MMDQRIFMKTLNDIGIKLMLCKSNFQWKILAEKYQESEDKIKEFYGQEIPEAIQKNLDSVRMQLVEKKAELPAEDLII